MLTIIETRFVPVLNSPSVNPSACRTLTFSRAATSVFPSVVTFSFTFLSFILTITFALRFLSPSAFRRVRASALLISVLLIRTRITVRRLDASTLIGLISPTLFLLDGRRNRQSKKFLVSKTLLVRELTAPFGVNDVGADSLMIPSLEEPTLGLNSAALLEYLSEARP